MIDYHNMSYKPVFVYGSLLTGLYNHEVIANEVIAVAQGVTEGVTMFANGDAFPFAFAGEGTITGQLFYLDAEGYAYGMYKLDRLEGFKDDDGDLYKRVTVKVTSADGAVTEAWMYLGSEDVRAWVTHEKMPLVADGNWRTYLDTLPVVEVELESVELGFCGGCGGEGYVEDGEGNCYDCVLCTPPRG